MTWEYIEHKNCVPVPHVNKSADIQASWDLNVQYRPERNNLKGRRANCRKKTVSLVLEPNSWASQTPPESWTPSKEIRNASRTKNGRSYYVCRRQNSDFRLVKVLRTTPRWLRRIKGPVEKAGWNSQWGVKPEKLHFLATWRRNVPKEAKREGGQAELGGRCFEE